MNSRLAADVATVDGGSRAAVRVAGAYKRFGTVEALGPLDLSIGPGEFVAVIGPSGCGKSTLLLSIGGLLRLSAGSVSIDGEPVTRPHPALGVVFQQPELMAWRSVLANVLLQQEIRGLPAKPMRERAVALLERVGLGGFLGHYPHELSGGMAQRVALCRALLHSPSLLLMDEPFGALDALTRDRMNSMLNEIWRAQGCTTVLVTHSIDEAVFLAQRVVVTTPRPARLAGEVRVDFGPERQSSLRATPRFLEKTASVRALLESVGAL